MLGGRFPSLASIRAFESAARLGSFTKAGRELGTSSASVSYHVRQLEAQIGVALFRRLAHRVELTEPGEMVATEASKAFAALRASFVRAAEAEEGRLSLTTLPTIGTSWLAPRLGHFRTLHPEIQLELDLSDVPEDLAGGRFDAAIRNGDGRWPGLRAVPLFPSLFMPLCVPALLDAARSLGDPAAPLAVPRLGRADWWQLWYRSRGYDAGPPPGSYGTTLATEYLDVAAALAGHGIVIASPILFRSELESGRLIAAHDFVVPAGRAFWFVYPVARQRSRKIGLFREWLCAEAAAACAASADLIARAEKVGPIVMPA
ncbi:LysR substrate-binding domain-containing protein [Sphingosinicella sp. BN140058]|uniref:LysR substrate-binding domain-containing protein n=1 Tax=Sphingosinicella sp. BN140058 TaxID=1892855 RepID=UPI001013B3BF|nr:LysR substrate-binding domain-containing protein [Sphingosinicella sp. BN140058]QAY79213.1 LysR family transcriptional regulator [Sphingosinicella sp. BN140058]